VDNESSNNGRVWTPELQAEINEWKRRTARTATVPWLCIDRAVKTITFNQVKIEVEAHGLGHYEDREWCLAGELKRGTCIAQEQVNLIPAKRKSWRHLFVTIASGMAVVKVSFPKEGVGFETPPSIVQIPLLRQHVSAGALRRIIRSILSA
jgi:hypothetical protein